MYTIPVILLSFHEFKGGGQAQNFWKVLFELWVGGRGQDMYQQFKVWGKSGVLA